jgi:hypothetical protein
MTAVFPPEMKRRLIEGANQFPAEDLGVLSQENLLLEAAFSPLLSRGVPLIQITV